MVETGQRFGGSWTEAKLRVIRDYLNAYTTALKNTAFELIYVDAFAGSGSRVPHERSRGATLFELEDHEKVLLASPRLALETTDRPFDRFLFVDKNSKNVAALEELVSNQYQSLAGRVQIERGDANQVISDFCHQTNWRRARAVLFLDPFGMQVDWSTIEAIAATRAIDLWYLFPTGMGLNRLMTKSGRMERSWENRINRSIGTDAWREEFYLEIPQPDLFGAEGTAIERQYSDDRAESFVIGRLKEIFAGGVVPKAIRLRNSRGQTMFILTFACSNPRAHQATKIAGHLVRKWEESDQHDGRIRHRMD